MRIVVGVDPPGAHAECGIVTAGVSRAKEVYLLDDRSVAGPPELWAARAVAAYEDLEADAIVYEENQGGPMVGSVIKTAWARLHPNARCPLIPVWASKGKRARAEPISLLWSEAGGYSGHIVGRLVALEDELCTWEPLSGMESPNRLDAAVWAATELTGKRNIGAITLDASEGMRPREIP